jgi:hypothetical protein
MREGRTAPLLRRAHNEERERGVFKKIGGDAVPSPAYE